MSRLHTEHGTRLLCGAAVAGLVGNDRVTGVELADGRRLAADVVVVGIGAMPNIEWLRDSPTRAGQRRRVRRGRGNARPECGCGRATVRPGTSRVSAGRTASSIGPARWSARPSRSPRCSPADGTTARRPNPRTSGPTSTARRIQFAGIADPGDEITFEVGSLRDASFLAVYRREGQLVAVLGVDQPRLFTRWRRQLAAVPVPRLTLSTSDTAPQQRRSR